MKKKIISIFVVILFLLIIQFIYYYVSNPIDSNQKGMGLKQSQPMEVIRLEEIAKEHENVEIVDDELVIEGKEIYKQKFSHGMLSVRYPEDRKVYGGDSFYDGDVFQLCPEIHCQDSELAIYFEDLTINDWLLDPQRPVSLWLDSNYSIRLYPKVIFRQMEGIGYEIISGSEENNRFISVAFETRSKLLHGYLNFNDDVHHNIWDSLEILETQN